MTSFVQRAKNILLQSAIERRFVDPITGEAPRTEEALSATLALYHHLGAIRWQEVRVRRANGGADGTAEALLRPTATLSTEYPLVYRNDREMNVWGGMRADLLYISRAPDRVVLIENKIGSSFTYGPQATDGQVGRQIQFLLHSRILPAHFILLTSAELMRAGSVHHRKSVRPVSATIQRVPSVRG